MASTYAESHETLATAMKLDQKKTANTPSLEVDDIDLLSLSVLQASMLWCWYRTEQDSFIITEIEIDFDHDDFFQPSDVCVVVELASENTARIVVNEHNKCIMGMHKSKVKK